MVVVVYALLRGKGLSPEAESASRCTKGHMTRTHLNYSTAIGEGQRDRRHLGSPNPAGFFIFSYSPIAKQSPSTLSPIP